MGFVFRGYDDNGVPRFDYMPDMKIEKETVKPSNSEPNGITPVPKSSPPQMKASSDETCPNPFLFFCAGCAVGAVAMLVLNQ
jgi:hypothetical protein